jgi:multiple sugar transport system permease protein
MRVRVDRVSGASATNAGTLGAGPGAQGQPLTLNVSPPFTEDQSPTVRARRLSGTERRRRRAGRLFVAPVVVIILGAVALPLGQAIYYSFTQWNGLTSVFSGLQNYTTGIFRDPNIGQILTNNAIILLSIPVGVTFSLLSAGVLTKIGRSSRVFRSVFFLPVAVSWVAIAIAAQGLLAYSGGVNTVLRLVDLGSLQRDWLGDPATALGAVVFTFNWAIFGLNTVILYAGMASVDDSVIEAAELDGAGWIRTLWHVTLPLIRRFIDLAFVITVVTALTQIFALIYVMTAGGPGYATTTLEFALYQDAFTNGSFGLAAAIGFILLLVTLVIAGLSLRSGTKSEGRA